jgi:hypothetical protein
VRANVAECVRPLYSRPHAFAWATVRTDLKLPTVVVQQIRELEVAMDDPVVVHVPVASPGTMWRLARLSTASPGTMWLIECAHLTADTSCTIRHLTSDCENGYCITCHAC